MPDKEQKFLDQLDKMLWNAADKLRSTLDAALWCGGKAALNQHLFKVISEVCPKSFFYYWTKYHLAVFQQIAADKAVTMGHIKRSHLKEAMCAVPDFGTKNLKIISDLRGACCGD